MRRPRHREKSNLLWKMLGIAALINLLLWPVLIHEVVPAGIHQEVLTPVRLVSLPPAQKLPDALQKVARASPAPAVKAPPVAPAPPRPATTAPLTAKKPANAAAPVRPQATAQKPVPKSPPRTAKQTAPPPHATPHPAHVAQAKPMTPVKHPTPIHREPTTHTARVVRPALQSRVARAKQLEAQGRKVAEQLSQQRAARVAALPPPVKPPRPVTPAPPAVPPSAGEAEHAAPNITVIPPTDEAPTAPPKPAPPVAAALVPAVAVSKSHPAVPDSMMKSAWHATFHGRFTVHPDGTAAVQMVSSTGFPILDRRAMEAARHWRFRPARLEGKPVASSQTFAFEFDVRPVR